MQRMVRTLCSKDPAVADCHHSRYHFRCVDLAEEDAEQIREWSSASMTPNPVELTPDLLDVYVCPPCSQKTSLHTVSEYAPPPPSPSRFLRIRVRYTAMYLRQYLSYCTRRTTAPPPRSLAPKHEHEHDRHIRRSHRPCCPCEPRTHAVRTVVVPYLPAL